MVSLVAWLLTLIFIDQQQTNLTVHTSSTAAISWAVHNSCFLTYFTYSTLTDLHLAFVESRREGNNTDGTGNHVHYVSGKAEESCWGKTRRWSKPMNSEMVSCMWWESKRETTLADWVMRMALWQAGELYQGWGLNEKPNQETDS